MKRKKGLHNKWIKTGELLKRKQLHSCIPTTKLLNSESLLSMLKEHKMVYIKPNVGSLGVGVMKVEMVEKGPKSGVWRYQHGAKVHRFPSFTGLYESIRQKIGSKRYLVQTGIHMLRYDNRPFDFRVMIQRKPDSRWRLTGIAARLAHPDKIVTNGSQGGTIYAAQSLIAAKSSPKKAEMTTKHMERIGLLAARQLRRAFPELWEIGLDIAVDQEFRPWILEVNTRPDPCPFKQLEDGRMLRRIIAHGKANGKTYALKCKKSRPGKL